MASDTPKKAGWGGARPGSGRKPRPPAPTPTDDPKEFLRQVMTGVIVPSIPQLDAAKALLRAQIAQKSAAKPGDTPGAHERDDKSSTPGWGGLLHGSMQ